MLKKKMLATVLSTILVFTVTACGAKDNSSSSAESKSSKEVNEIDATSMGSENFIQFDENGKPYIEAEDGTREYLDESEIESENSESKAETKPVEKIKGDYEKFNLSAKIADDWYGVDTDDATYFYPDGFDSGYNYYSLTSFETAGLEAFGDWTADSITEDFNNAVEQGAYKAAEFVRSEDVTVDGAQGLLYETKITNNDDLVIDMTSYIINDEFGGHVLILSDLDDNIDCQEAFKSFIESISFK